MCHWEFGGGGFAGVEQCREEEDGTNSASFVDENGFLRSTSA